MWNVGFFPKENLKRLSSKSKEDVISLFSNLSSELNVNIVAGSISNIKDEEVCNTSYIFDRNGECIAKYDKIHLFSPMKENDYFKSGDKIVTFDLDGEKCGIIICYDLRFVELIRTLALKEIKILFVVAQWPEQRINHWNILNKARAIENQIFVVSTNSCGKAEETQYGGYSKIIGPFGDIISEAGKNEEIISAELDLSILKNIRETINVYNDRKPSLYNIL
jgi:predicted amidohydrolase